MDLPSTPSSSRILYDVPCAVCRDHSSGKHYGVYACDGCAGFFKRSVRRQRSYVCKARIPGCCLVDKTHRNQCRACRMDKCLEAGMNRDAVQHERGPRNSTIRRQMALFMNDGTAPNEMRVSIQPVPEVVLPKRVLFPAPPPPPPFNFFYPFFHSGIDLPSPPVIPYPRTFTAPPLFPGLLLANEPGQTCEAAAKLLFINVTWAKGIPLFQSLSIEDQIYLIEETWKDLFVIGVAQFLYPLDLKVLLNQKNIAIDTQGLELFQLAMTEFAKLRPNSMEINCLRGVILFRNLTEEGASGSNNLQDSYNVAAEQERNRNMLTEYVAFTHPLERFRAIQLLEWLPVIGRVPSATVVDLFFRTTIGNISIERVICDMYKTA